MKKKQISRREALKRMGGFFALTAMASYTGLAATSCKSSTETETTTVTGKRLIFFFSATGNSLYVGKTIAGEEGQMLSIPQEIHKEHPVYEAEEIGFVFPLYCFIPPTIVQNFIRKSTFKADYIFAVGTYGANYTLFPEYFDKLAEECGFSVNYISAVKMVDTYLPYYNMEVEKATDKNTEENLTTVVAEINRHENYRLPITERDRFFYEGYYRHSGRDRVNPTFTRSEKVVYSTEDCIGCGICTNVCPHGSWKVVNGKSVAEGECENCLSCVQNCPSKAISIIRVDPEPDEPNRNARYRNPNVTLVEIIRANHQV